MATLWKILTRKKVIDPARAEESSLARVLTTFDLTALGVGSTLGVGMYVLVGKVAKETAGPSVVLSFLIAAIASTFAALCYAEFGARAPRAGSAYIYSYVCVGEFIAFVIGWNLILEYVIGSASVARGMSLYIDALVNNTMKNAFIDIAPINIPYLSAYFDFLTFTITVVLSCGLAFGMKESSRLNNVFTTLNIFVVLFVIIAGSTKADPKNWELEAPKNITNGGSGGFFPFGIGGMLKGAATCFYGFVGFDCIATTGEEVKNPQRAIPIAIIVSLLVVFLAYFGTATVVTLMVPYYLQDVNSPIPHAFEEFGWEAAKWIVTLGGICALFASLFGAMFPLPRILYAMASDGLVFKFLGRVNSRFSTPVIGTLLAGLFTGLMGAMFEQDQLINMMSIGTLLAYTIVAASILLLRYSVDEEGYSLAHSDSDSSVSTYTDNRDLNPSGDSNESTDECGDPIEGNVSFVGLLKQCFNYRKFGRPTKLSEKLVSINVCIYCLLCLLLGLSLIYLVDDISHGEIHAIVITSVLGMLMILTLMSIGTQPESKKALSFKVPLVPLVPALSILINIYLMLCLDVTTWIRFGVWMALGLPIYFYSAHCYSKDVSQLAFKNSISLGNSNSYVNFGYIHEGSKRGSCNSDSAYFEDDSTVEKEEKNDVIHDILANLDNILERESRDSKVFSRKMSVDTVSNVSNTVLEENIVAIIHREDEPIIEEESDELLNVPTVCCVEGAFEEEVTSLESFKMVPGRISYQKSEIQMKSSDKLNVAKNINEIEYDKDYNNEIILKNDTKTVENDGCLNNNETGSKHGMKSDVEIKLENVDLIQNAELPTDENLNGQLTNIENGEVENYSPNNLNGMVKIQPVSDNKKNATGIDNITKCADQNESSNSSKILNDENNYQHNSESSDHLIKNATTKKLDTLENINKHSEGDLKSLQNNSGNNENATVVLRDVDNSHEICLAERDHVLEGLVQHNNAHPNTNIKEIITYINVIPEVDLIQNNNDALTENIAHSDHKNQLTPKHPIETENSKIESEKDYSDNFVASSIPTTIGIPNIDTETTVPPETIKRLSNDNINLKTDQNDKSLKISIPTTLGIPKTAIETPVTPEAVKRLDEILHAEELTFIPIPPSMDDFEKSKILKLPRVQSTRPKFVRKKSPAIPPIDYDAEKDDIAVDTVKIGSKEHDNLKKKLNAILFKKSAGMPQPNKLTKPEVVEIEAESVNVRKKSITSIMDRIISEIPSKKEDEPDLVKSDVVADNSELETGEEEVVKVEDIRSKLNKLFASDAPSKRAPKKISAAISNITQELLKKDEVVSSKTFPRNKPEQEDHKRLMLATLNSIKLRKMGGVDDS